MKRDGIYLAYRREAARGATWWQRLFCAFIRFRLASAWCHGGVVCDGTLYHMTLSGAQSTDDWTPARWDLFELPRSYKPKFYAVWEQVKDFKYDWFSQLAFALPGRFSDGSRDYCFELHTRLFGGSTRERSTPERGLRALVAAWRDTGVLCGN